MEPLCAFFVLLMSCGRKCNVNTVDDFKVTLLRLEMFITPKTKLLVVYNPMLLTLYFLRQMKSSK